MKPKELTSKTANAITEMMKLRGLHGQAILTTEDGKSPMAAVVAEDYFEAGKQAAHLQGTVLGWLYNEGKSNEALDYFKGYLTVARPELNKLELRREASKMYKMMAQSARGR